MPEELQNPNWHETLPSATKASLEEALSLLRSSSFARKHCEDLVAISIVTGIALPAIVIAAITAALLSVSGPSPHEWHLSIAFSIACLPIGIATLFALRSVRFVARCSALAGFSQKTQSEAQKLQFEKMLASTAAKGGKTGEAAILAMEMLPLLDERKKIFEGRVLDELLLTRMPTQDQFDQEAAECLKEKLAASVAQLEVITKEINRLASAYSAASVRVAVAENLEGYILGDKPHANQVTELLEPDTDFTDESGRLKVAVSLKKVAQH